MGLFSRGGSGGGKPNPMGAKLAGVVPQVPEVVPGPPADLPSDVPSDVDPVAGPVAGPVATSTASAPAAAPASGSGSGSGGSPAGGMTAVRRGANTTSLGAAAPSAVGGPVLFSVQAGYNLPTPDPFARNRQKVGRSFGEVVVGDGVLMLRLRRKRVGLFIPPLEVRADEIALVAPTETDFMGNNRGVVLVRPDGEHLYVWVDDPAALLGTLAGKGFTTGDDPVAVTRAG